MRPLIALAITASLLGCTSRLQRNVQGLSVDGEYVAATELLLEARATGDDDAALLLEATAADAYEAELDRARMLEADGLPEDALTAYDGLLSLGARVREAGGPVLPPAVRPEREAIARTVATRLAARAAVAFEARRYQAALDGWREAEALDPDATDAEQRIPQALTRLGDGAREEHRYREAIALYDEAVEVGGGEEPRVWAAAIHAALGRHALKEGACRQAVEAFRQASALPFDVRLAEDFEQARACATREVVVHPFEDLVEGGIDDDNLGVLLVDQLSHHLRTHGSRYVVLLDPESPAARGPAPEAGHRYHIRGHLTRVQVAEGEATRAERSAPGVIQVVCPGGSEPTCEEEVQVAYTLTTERLEVDIAGAIKVVEESTGEQVATRPLDIQVKKQRYRASDAKVTDVRGFVVKAPVGVEASETRVGVQGEAVSHFAPSPPLPEADRVVDEAMVRLAATAADAVLAAVDAPPPVPDPEHLHLVTPVMRAEDITFGEAVIEEHTPDDIELGGSAVERDAPAADAGSEDPADGG
jgi:tetratricopeptide (TPR) repeat protein